MYHNGRGRISTQNIEETMSALQERLAVEMADEVLQISGLTPYSSTRRDLIIHTGREELLRRNAERFVRFVVGELACMNTPDSIRLLEQIRDITP
jgi:hypothetical protein